MTDGIDLTGRWEGVYFYPIHEEMNPFDDLPATPFKADVMDRAGLIEGRSLEPDLFGDTDAPPIPALWEGHHADGEVTFTKFPDGGGQIHTIDYFGSIRRCEQHLRSLDHLWRVGGNLSDATKGRGHGRPGRSDRPDLRGSGKSQIGSAAIELATCENTDDDHPVGLDLECDLHAAFEANQADT